MNHPLVTIIIPVYNAERYIKKCLDSVLAQTFDNYEVICIDDGSKDNSYSILQIYQKSFPEKIRIYKQENAGVAETRNRGIEYSKGKYIFFVDNDDTIESEYLQKHVDLAEATGDDMVISGYKRVNEEGNSIFQDKTKPDAFWEPFKRFAPWGRIYRRDFIVNNNLRFLNNIIGEDDYFNILAATKTDKISVTEYVGYNWTFNTKSISNTQHDDPKLRNAAVHMLDQVYTDLNKSVLTTLKGRCVEYSYIKFSVWFMLFYGRKLALRELLRAYEDLFSTIQRYFPRYFKNPLIGLFTPKGENFGTRLAVCIFMILHRLKLSKAFLRAYHALNLHGGSKDDRVTVTEFIYEHREL